MKVLLKSCLLILTLTFGSLSFGAPPVPGNISILDRPYDQRWDGRDVRVYGGSTTWHKNLRYQGALVKYIARGKLPTCSYSQSNKQWTNKNRARISAEVVEYRTNRIFWKNCNMSDSNWHSSNQRLLFGQLPGNRSFSSRYGYSLWTNIILPLDQPNGSSINPKPVVTDWKMF